MVPIVAPIEAPLPSMVTIVLHETPLLGAVQVITPSPVLQVLSDFQPLSVNFISSLAGISTKHTNAKL